MGVGMVQLKCNASSDIGQDFPNPSKSRKGVSPNFQPRRVSLRQLVEQQIPPPFQREKNSQKHKDLQSFNVINVFRHWYN